MRVGSLFAGIGGFDLGFERAGHETVWQVELDEKCREVYNVGRNEPITINHLFATIAREMGRTDVFPDYTGGLPGAVTYRCPDVRKLEALGWSSRVDLADGLRRTIDYLLRRREEWPE